MSTPHASTPESPWTHWYRRLLPAYWVFLFCCTHFPKLQLDLGIEQSDKVAHVVAFGLLAFFFWRFAETFQPRPTGRFVWLAGGGLAAYAAIDEYTQGFVGRSVSVWDWLAGVGGMAVVLVVLEWRRRGRAQHA